MFFDNFGGVIPEFFVGFNGRNRLFDNLIFRILPGNNNRFGRSGTSRRQLQNDNDGVALDVIAGSETLFEDISTDNHFRLNAV